VKDGNPSRAPRAIAAFAPLAISMILRAATSGSVKGATVDELHAAAQYFLLIF
jgi:hypothetical protein